MRLEENPRAMCYNLYCDTESEQAKMKQMLEKPIYADTDGIKLMKTELNSEYGRLTMIAKDYIVVHRAKKPIIIFKKSILAVEQDDDKTAVIYCSENALFYVDEQYADVIKQLI